MKFSLKFCSTLFFWLFCAATFVAAQTDSSPTTDDAKHEFGVWGGYSPDSTTSLIGRTPDARFGIVGLHYARIFRPGDKVALKYTIDAVPLAVLSFPRVFSVFDSRETVYGVGAAPVGLQLNFRRQKKAQPFVNGSGGFLVFKRKIPEEFFGARFNFTFDFGGGVQVKTSERRAVTFGYRYHHISNANRASDNPGFDSNIFYVGYSIFK